MKKIFCVLLLTGVLASSLNAQEVSKLQHGYRGFVEYGFGAFKGLNGPTLMMSTSHGKQFNDYLFLGGGADFMIVADNSATKMSAAFVDFKASLPTDNHFLGALDLKYGIAGIWDSSIWEAQKGYWGIRFNPSIRLGGYINPQLAFYGSLGYVCQHITDVDVENHQTTIAALHGFNVSMGIEF